MARGYPDFEGGKSGLYLQPEWATKQGLDKLFTGTGGPKAFGGSISATYVVPASKTLYVLYAAFYCKASDAANGNNNQMAVLTLNAPTVLTRVAMLGGNGGGFMSFPSPIRVDAAETFAVVLYAFANHDADIGFAVGGYEI